MANRSKVVELEHVVIRFAGDSGDGMQLTGNLFSLWQAMTLPRSRTILEKSVHHKELCLAFQDSRCILDTNRFTPQATSAMCSSQ